MSSAVSSSTRRTWSDALDRAAQWADQRDADAGLGTDTTVAWWAATKAGLGLAAAPLTLPALTVAAATATRIANDRITRFPDHLHALAEGREPPLPGHRTQWSPASERYLITSDLHRCIAGRLDWPGRQGVKDLYLAVIAGYAQEGWHLIENGDVEDFWMVGGSTWGAVYDVAYLTGSAIGAGHGDPRRQVLAEQLDRIVDNNAEIYDLLREGYGRDGRYHRTMGNHDDVYADPGMVERLGHHLPGVEVADTILLSNTLSSNTLSSNTLSSNTLSSNTLSSNTLSSNTLSSNTLSSNTSQDTSISDVEAVVAHGHLTDPWNGHGFATLGHYVTWLVTGLDDLPGARRVEQLPGDGLSRLLNGRARNRLIQIGSRYGGNRRFDSLDEERLFAALREQEPQGGWPWLVYGHTHFPMLSPLDAQGRPVRYANSGCGVLNGAISALEWDNSDPEHPLRLVVWRSTPDGPRRIELVPDGASLRPVDERAGDDRAVNESAP